jgi:hypothetical protein
LTGAIAIQATRPVEALTGRIIAEVRLADMTAGARETEHG